MFVINVVFIISLIAYNVIGASTHEYPKIRRAGSMTIYPFPRVGRSQPERTWMTPLQELPDAHDEMKRAYLIPFPRVGRAMYEQNGKRSNGDAPGGMWFGPRLGRVSKRNYDGYDEDLPWAMMGLKDAFPHHFASKEIEDQADDDQIEQADQANHQNIETQ